MFKLFVIFIIFSILSNCYLVLSYKFDVYYNLVLVGSASEVVSDLCRNELSQIANGIDGREIWAMKILDASGRFGAGFVYGNNYMLGSRKGCVLLQDPIPLAASPMIIHLHYENLTHVTSPFPVEYRVIYVRHTSKLQFDLQIYDRKVLHLGVCLPKSCSNDDVFATANHVFETLDFSGREMVGNTTVLSTKALKLRDNFWNDSFVKLYTFLTLFSIINVIIGTIYTWRIKKVRKMLEKKDDDAIKQYKRSLAEKWFNCFSLSNNFNGIMSMNTGSGSLASIHGVRALSMPWLVVGHIILYGQGSIANIESNLTYTELWYFQPLTTDFLGVDTFIALSGFLISYLFFEHQKKNPNKKHGLGTVMAGTISRYIRLAPYLFIVVLMSYVMTIYLEDTTPFKLGESLEKNCGEYWWRNLFLINNLFSGLDLCLSWSWFASNDFQSFIVGISVLVIYSKNKKNGLLIGGGITVACILYSMIVVVVLKYSLSLDAYYHFQNYVYLPPWNRLPPYFVGMICGHYLSSIDHKLKLPLGENLFYWASALAGIFGGVFFHMHKVYDPVYLPLYSGFGKMAWALGICWIIIACSTGNGGFMAKILELKYLLPLSRMSYSMYLTNALVIPFIYFNAENSHHVFVITYIAEALGILIVCLLFSIISMLIYENPLNMLIRTFVDRK